LLRNIIFPSIIDAIALDPGEHVFYAGSRDGKIYIAALNAESTSSSKYGLHIINSLSNHRFVSFVV
jgi:pre-rRNA-processing protein IPI3